MRFAAGVTDIASGVVQIDGCNIEWDTNPSHVTLDTGGLSNSNCSIVSQTNNTSVVGNPKALALQFSVKFSEVNFVGTHEVHAWAMNAEGLESPSMDMGAIVVTQGQDFTLSVTPTGDPNFFLKAPQSTPIALTLSSTALNGFSGPISLSFIPFGGTSFQYCFGFTYSPDGGVTQYSGLPTSMSAGNQYLLTFTNTCSAGQALEFTVQGMVTGVATRSSLPVYLLSASTPDFTVTAGAPVPAVLAFQSSVSFPVTVASLFGDSGTVTLSVAAAPGSSLPTGVSCGISPSSVFLNSNGAATSAVTCTGSATTPGGSVPLVITGSLGAVSHGAQATLSTQTITFTTVSAPPVLNNGNPTTITLAANGGSIPSLTSCATGDPAVACSVSGSGNQVTVTITASSGATHGTRIVKLNGGALTSQADVFDGTPFLVGGSIPPIVAGSTETVQISVENFNAPCEIDGACPYMTVDVGGPGWVTVQGGSDNEFFLVITPPIGTSPGDVSIPLDVCEQYDSDLLDGPGCEFSALGVEVEAPPPTVTITSRPIRITASPSTPGTYTATLASQASPPGGTYSWTTNNPSMVGFMTPSSGPNAGAVTLGIVSTNSTATVTLTYFSPYGGSASDSFAFALTNDTTVVAWVDASKVTPDPTHLDPNDPAVTNLGSPNTCAAYLLLAQGFGEQGETAISEGWTPAETVYANQFLISGTGNSPPPQQSSSPWPSNPNDSGFVASQNYRLYQRFQAYYEVANGLIASPVVTLHGKFFGDVQIGVTPEPCSGLHLFSLAAEPNVLNGDSFNTNDHTLTYQINEVRLGPKGQAVNYFLNGVQGQSVDSVTPWIWSVVEFDANGNTRAWTQGATSNNLQIFPAYQVYTNGFALQAITQGDLMTFIGLNSTSQFMRPQ